MFPSAGPHQSDLHARWLPRPTTKLSPHQPGPTASGLPTGAGVASGLIREQAQAARRIWVTHHLDAPVPGAGGLSQAEEGNGRQVRVRDVCVGSILGLLQAWRRGRGAPGPRLLCDSRLRGQGYSRRGGRRAALSHVSAERGAWGRKRSDWDTLPNQPPPKGGSPASGCRPPTSPPGP